MEKASRDLSRVREIVEWERERQWESRGKLVFEIVKYVGCTFCKSVSVEGNNWL